MENLTMENLMDVFLKGNEAEIKSLLETPDIPIPGLYVDKSGVRITVLAHTVYVGPKYYAWTASRRGDPVVDKYTLGAPLKLYIVAMRTTGYETVTDHLPSLIECSYFKEKYSLVQ